MCNHESVWHQIPFWPRISHSSWFRGARTTASNKTNLCTYHVVREDLLDESHLLLIEILVSAALTLERNGIIGRKRTFVLPQLVLLDALFLLNLLLVEVFCAWAIERAIVRANAVEVTETRSKLLLLLDISFGQCTVVGVVFVRRAPNEGAVNKV